MSLISSKPVMFAIKLFNDKLSVYRQQLIHELTVQGRKLLKGYRWLLLKNPETLDLRIRNGSVWSLPWSE